MGLQTSGAISLNDMHVEAGGSTGTLVEIDDADVRALLSPTPGSETEMSFDDWYGASAPISYLGSTSTIQGAAASGGVYYLSLTALGLQEGDMVIVATAQDGPGDSYTTGYNTSGWTQQLPVTFGTGTEPGFASYYKIMGSTPDTSFGWTLGAYPFDVPMVAVAFRNVGTRTTQQYASVGYNTSCNIPTRTVANAGSVSIITTSRGGNNAIEGSPNFLNTPSGYTKAIHKECSNSGIGYNWKQAVDIYYKLNCPAGSLNPGTHTWYFLGDANVNHSIFY